MINESTKAVPGKEPKRINLLIDEIQRKILYSYEVVTNLENQLYPILEDLVEDLEEDKCVEEAEKEPVKLEGKLDNISSDISIINSRIKNILEILQIERF